MNTSPLRPIRHTATYIALKLCSAICEIAAEVKKDLSIKQRQKEAEVKKGSKKVKEAEKKVTESQTRLNRLEDYLKDTFDV
jgi:cohesin complex subunit SA-1/2